MIVGMIGNIHRLEPMMVEFEVNGLIYGIHISTNTSYVLNTQKEKVQKLFISEIIREDAHLLFGFVQEMEKITFERLIKINGVGPKVALAILCTYSPEAFGKIIEEKNIVALQRVPGIGAKGAGKIMVDLAGFFNEITDSQNTTKNEEVHNQALQALQTLGFKSADIIKVLKTTQGSNTQEIIKEALKILK
ncbi:Holliday junction DNA helicase RuvA [Helicobacter sp. 13S00482-2]|uniref:Holliday junction branch migration protein RuvA n=1 Tax=Helicobacter sp. 13S00482-2 TaxID=1476200 RepID=UPI000BA6F81F|nr:Holliday junction branch migration protein RuvA [Helicobacter sp. 13S00482-2]PAF53953.1 Holliday junction DNA helicase RuvA [Helicobacter sp. 13S00482-2]